MSEVPGDGAVAGRLEVVVEAALRNFATELKRKVEDASQGVKAKVGAEIDAEGLREKLKAKVDEAAADVTAKIGVDFDAGMLKAKVAAAAHAASTDVNVGVDTKGIVPEVAAATEAAQAASGQVDVPVKAKLGTLLRSVLAAKLEAQLAAARSAIKIPVKVDEKQAKKSIGGLRGLLRGSLIAGLVSMIQPALGAISQLVSGLTAMVGAALPAVNTIAAFPITIGAFVQGMLAGKVAVQGLSGALNLLAKQKKGPLSPEEAKQLKQALGELSPSAGAFAKKLVGLRDDWVRMRKKVQEPLFKPLAKEIEPLAHNLLPVLAKGLSGTTTVFGRWVTTASAWLRSPAVKGDIGKVFKSNNRLLAAFGTGLGDAGAGMLDFVVAARPFTRRIGEVAKGFGAFLRAKSAKGRRTGSTEEFLDKAGDRLSLVWKMTKNVAGGFRGIFKAGDSTGLKLFTDFDHFLANWNKWANGPDGQKRMKEFFKNTAPGFREIAGIVHDAGIAWLKMGEDPGIVKMLRQIRTELGPALSKFLTNLGDNLAPSVIDALTSILEALAEMAPATKALGQVVSALAGLVSIIAKLVKATGPVGDAALSIVGYVLAWRMLKRLGGISGKFLGLGSLASNTDAAGAAMGRTATKADRLKGSINRLKGAAGRAAPVVGLFATSMVLGKVGEVINRNDGVDAAFSGFDAAAAKRAGKSKEALKRIMLGLQNSAFGEWASKNGTDMDMVAQGIYDQMNHHADTAASQYLNSISDALDKVTAGAGKNKKHYAGHLLKDLIGDDVVIDAEGAADALSTVQSKVDALRGDLNSSAKEAKQSWKDLLGRPIAPKGPKKPKPPKMVAGNDDSYADFFKNSFGKGGKKAPTVDVKVKATGTGKVLASLWGVEKAGKQASNAMSAGKAVDSANKTVAANKRVAKSFQGVQNAAKTAKAKAIMEITSGSSGKVSANKDAAGYAKSWKKAAHDAASAVAAGKGPIRTAASGNASAAKGPIKPLPGWFHTYGVNMSQGFAAGMGSALGQIRTAAAAMAAAADAAVRAKAQIKSPSKAMKKLGRWVSQGFAQGILGGVGEVQHAAAELYKRVGAIGRKGLAASLKKRFANDFKKLEEYARKRADLAARLEAAQTKLDEIMSKKQALVDSVTQSGEDFSSVASIAGANGGFLNPGFLVGELSRRLASAKQFASALNQLRGMGFGEPTIRQIASEGIENGLALAKQLLSSTPDQVAQINNMQGQITKIAGDTATTTASALYDAGINAAQGLVNGLKSQSAELEKVAKALANTIVKTIKKALGIKSPSRVTHALGAFTTEGMTRGLRSGRHGLMKEAKRMSADLASGLAPAVPISSGKATYARLAASGTSAATAMFPAGSDQRGAAPIVEHLELSVGSKADLGDALDETMHTLRKIKNGGVHADRAA